MEPLERRFTIVMVDDNPDDYYLVKDALEENALRCDVRLVADAKELLDYLYQMGPCANPERATQPDLILLYMSTPQNDAWEGVVAIKSDPSLRWIPIVVVNGSKKFEDITRCYESGARSYIPLPETFESLVEVIDTTVKYWMTVVKLPGFDWQSGPGTLELPAAV